MFHKTVRFQKLTSDIPKTYSYKGLHFPLHEKCLISLGNDVEFGGKIETKLVYSFFGRLLLTEEQIRERVDIMVKRGEHKYVAKPAAA